jgi:hypothetical protein
MVAYAWEELTAMLRQQPGHKRAAPEPHTVNK